MSKQTLEGVDPVAFDNLVKAYADAACKAMEEGWFWTFAESSPPLAEGDECEVL